MWADKSCRTSILRRPWPEAGRAKIFGVSRETGVPEGLTLAKHRFHVKQHA
jgi:hypothetical protein